MFSPILGNYITYWYIIEWYNKCQSLFVSNFLLAKEVKPDFVKTSTGFGTGGATIADVQLMKKVVGNDVKVKAAGGIRDLNTALKMIEAGAERLGTSSGIKIIEEYQRKG